MTVNKGSYAYEWAAENGYIYPESAHPYAANTDETWTYTWPGEADYLRVSFSMKCELADDDYLTLTDGDGSTYEYSYHDLRGLSLYVKGRSFSLQLESDESDEAYGFSIDTIQAMTTAEVASQPFMTRVLNDGTLAVTGYAGEATDIVIPSMIDGNKVTSIDYFAFSGDERLVSVEISEGVEEIGFGALSWCPNLKNLVIRGSEIYIKEDVGNGCVNLESVTVPGLIYWADFAFDGCDAVSSVTFTDVGEDFNAYRLFRFCDEYIIEPESDYYCSVDGVLYDKSLTKLVACPGARSGAYTIPDTVTAIGDDAFVDCAKLTSVAIPESVTSIGAYAFSGCSGLQSIVIPYGVEVIGQGTFQDCSSLESVTVPDSVTSIGDSAFDDCSESLVIYGKAGSCAETYATEHGIAFIAE